MIRVCCALFVLNGIIADQMQKCTYSLCLRRDQRREAVNLNFPATVVFLLVIFFMNSALQEYLLQPMLIVPSNVRNPASESLPTYRSLQFGGSLSYSCTLCCCSIMSVSAARDCQPFCAVVKCSAMYCLDLC